MSLLSPTKRERSKAIIEEEPAENENGPKVESTLTSRVSQCCGKINQLNLKLRPFPLPEAFNPEAAAVGELQLSQ